MEKFLHFKNKKKTKNKKTKKQTNKKKTINKLIKTKTTTITTKQKEGKVYHHKLIFGYMIIQLFTEKDCLCFIEKV